MAFGNYTKHFGQNLKLALPIMGGQLGQIAVNLADNLMVGKLGAASLAAVALANSIFVVFIVLGMGLSFALPPLISEADGAGTPQKISSYFKHSMLINVLFALVTLIILHLGIPLLWHFGQDAEVVLLAIPYLKITAWSIIPLMIFQTLRCYSDGLGETMPPMIAIIIGNIVNIGLNYVFIFGNLGIKAYGASGAAIASLIARILMILTMIIIIAKWKNLKSYITNINFRSYKQYHFSRILHLGIPSSLQGFFEISAFSGAALIMGMIGKNEQAAHQIAINLASITFLIVTGFSMASTIRVGNQLGKRDYLELREVGLSVILQVILIMSIGSLIFIALHDYLPTLYIDDRSVISIAGILLLYAAVFQIPDGVQVVSLGALRGLQDVRIPTFLTLISYWLIGIPISYITAIKLHWGPQGVWLGLIVGLTISAGLLTWRFQSKTKRLIDADIEIT